MGAACLCACRQVVQLHRRWMAQTKSLSLVPLLQINRESQDVARVRPLLQANELIHNKTQQKKNKQEGFTHL